MKRAPLSVERPAKRRRVSNAKDDITSEEDGSDFGGFDSDVEGDSDDEFKVGEVEEERADSNPDNGDPTAPTAPADDADDADDDDAPTKTFFQLGINESICDACNSMGYKTATPIQVASIPPALEGRDVIGVAETGSGKTAAFALPILQTLLEKPHPFYALVLAPTRELAIQTGKAFEALGSVINAKVAVIVGGVNMVDQMVQLGKKPHIIVATPGRLLDHLEKSKGFSLFKIKYLVMDEADKLLELDFGPALEKIFKFLPRERNTYLFSATMSTKVERLQRASLRDPIRVSVTKHAHQTAEKLHQSLWVVPQMHKDLCLVYLMNNFAGKAIIVFVRTFRECQRLAIMLRHLGFGAVPLYGKLPMSARISVLNKFRERSREILIATDVAARGLDIPSVDLVVNFDLPQDSKTYVHRVGRTARAGRSGKAINMCTQYDIEVFLRIENMLGYKMGVYEEYDEDLLKPLVVSVENAQREAKRDMKDLARKEKGRKGGKSFKGGRDKDDEEG